MTRTNALTRACLEWLLFNGYMAWRSNQIPIFDKATGTPRRFVGMKGVPDIVAISPTGQFVGVEIKCGKDKLSEFQKAFQMDCLNRGAKYIVVKENIDELTQQLERTK